MVICCFQVSCMNRFVQSELVTAGRRGLKKFRLDISKPNAIWIWLDSETSSWSQLSNGEEYFSVLFALKIFSFKVTCFVSASEKNRLFSRFLFFAARIKARLMSHTQSQVQRWLPYLLSNRTTERCGFVAGFVERICLAVRPSSFATDCNNDTFLGSI